MAEFFGDCAGKAWGLAFRDKPLTLVLSGLGLRKKDEFFSRLFCGLVAALVTFRLLRYMGCSQNCGLLFAIDYITALNFRGTKIGP